MKKYVYILILIFLSSFAQAHSSHYKGMAKIEMEVFRNNEVIGYSNYFFEHENNSMTVKNYTQFKVKLSTFEVIDTLGLFGSLKILKCLL